jgi:hypothetical protein
MKTTSVRLNEAVKRNRDRFRDDFIFQLTREEFANLISQLAISSYGHGGRRKLPWVTATTPTASFYSTAASPASRQEMHSRQRHSVAGGWRFL